MNRGDNADGLVRKRRAHPEASKGDNNNLAKLGEESKEINEKTTNEAHFPLPCKWLKTRGVVNVCTGVIMMLILAVLHSLYLYTIHENNSWFSNIKPVEREISFRTEAGLYYSYYKQLIMAPSFVEGVNYLMNDNITEHLRTINILERFNIYQEVILAGIHRGLGLQIEPIFFYIKVVFGLQSLLVCSIYLTTWLLSDSWVAACLAACFYSLNGTDATRVAYVVPLRESFALPFLWFQLLCVTYYLQPSCDLWKRKLSICLIVLSQFIFGLFWQFAQFILLLQSAGLFATALLGIINTQKVYSIYRCTACSLLMVCFLQFGNKMVLTSLVIAFMPMALIVLAFKDEYKSAGIIRNCVLTAFYLVLSVILTGLVNRVVRYLVNHASDQHVFQFLLHKLGLGKITDFDAMLYLCQGAFGWLDADTYHRLITTWVLTAYTPTHLILIVIIIIAVFRYWKDSNSDKAENGNKQNSIMFENPHLAFNIVNAVLFAAIAICVLRFKFLWLVYMCILAAYGVSNQCMWRYLLSPWRIQGTALEVIRHGVTAMVILGLLLRRVPHEKKELDHMREFYDPDTVQLMDWINARTLSNEAFSGSMQLMAGVKLCTGRPISNHPHYEDYTLRQRTKTLYAYYGRIEPNDMYKILVYYNVTYIIMEDSICLAPSTGCRKPDLVDLHRGQIPDHGRDELGTLKHSDIPRFCNEIRYGKSAYTKYFTLSFRNRTFRIYRVLAPIKKSRIRKSSRNKSATARNIYRH